MSYATSYIGNDLQPNNLRYLKGATEDIQDYRDYGAVIFSKCKDAFRELISGDSGAYQLTAFPDSNYC